MNEKKLEVFESIIEAAQNNNDISEFGQQVAEILKNNKLIDDAVFEVLTKK